MSAEELPDRLRRFAESETASSPLYSALAGHIADDADLRAAVAALTEDFSPTLFFAAVHFVLTSHPDDALAAYYRSLGGEREPDAELPAALTAFLAAHRERLADVLATHDIQSNDPLRAAQLLPALGWAQACFGRPLGLIEIGASAGLLLHADRYSYRYEFQDGSLLEHGDPSGLVLPCPVVGAATPKSLAPFVTKGLRIRSRVGLDLNPLDPSDPQARAWLHALVWPEDTTRRARLEAALESAARRPVRLRKGDALRILADAVAGVQAPAVPCVFASNSLAHFPAEGRTAFASLARELGARHDLVLVMKEPAAAGLRLFAPDTPSSPDGEENLAAVVFQSGRERVFSLGRAGARGAWLDWDPRPR